MGTRGTVTTLQIRITIHIFTINTLLRDQYLDTTYLNDDLSQPPSNDLPGPMVSERSYDSI